MIPNEISRPAHLLAVTGRSGVRQLSLVGGRVRFGVEDSEPASCGLAMCQQSGVVPLALDLLDKEPPELLLRPVVRVHNCSIVARPREGHVRKDLLVNGALD